MKTETIGMTVKLLGQLLLSIIVQILFIIPKAIILILTTMEGFLRIIRKSIAQFIEIVNEELP